MKATGIVKRIDDLGRIVIPRDIRKQCGIKTDDPLEIFYDKEEQTVMLKRYKTEGELREEWVNKWYEEFQNACSATSKRVGNMTIVAWEGCIETACCRRGDPYNRRVGEAICMAKLCGERIPDYI